MNISFMFIFRWLVLCCWRLGFVCVCEVVGIFIMRHLCWIFNYLSWNTSKSEKWKKSTWSLQTEMAITKMLSCSSSSTVYNRPTCYNIPYKSVMKPIKTLLMLPNIAVDLFWIFYLTMILINVTKICVCLTT